VNLIKELVNWGMRFIFIFLIIIIGKYRMWRMRRERKWISLGN
jgi:hypothetical protein